MVDQILLARLLFGLTASFHIVFPCLIIGLAIYLAVMEIAWLRTKREIYRTQYQFWIKPFTVVFVIGMISGLVLSYELDTFFQDFYHRTAEILLPIRHFELANALILEAGALGIMLCGWRRVGPRLHLFATLMMVVGVLIAGVCILARNSWMQTPDGFQLIEGQIVLTDWPAAIISPSFPYRFLHMLGAAMLATAFFIAGICARYLLKQQHTVFAKHGLRVSLLAVIVLAPLQMLSGDLHGLNTHHHQPVKLAAMEGLWDTQKGAPLVLFGLPDNEAQKNRYALEIPRLASLIITHSAKGEIKGLKEVPRNEQPNVTLVFISFRIMVALGLLMLLAGLVGVYLMRRQRLYHSRGFLRLCYLMTPSGLMATIAGWCVTEAGRQPWVVSGLLRTAEVSTPLSASQAAKFLTCIGISYLSLLGLFAYALVRFIRQGPRQNNAAAATFEIPEAQRQEFEIRLGGKNAPAENGETTNTRPVTPYRWFDWGLFRPSPSAGVGFALGMIAGAVIVFYAPLHSPTKMITFAEEAMPLQKSAPLQIPIATTIPDQDTDQQQKELALARTYANLGSLYFTRGDLKQADAMYRDSLTRYEQAGYLEGTADTYTNLGTVYWKRGQLDEAEAMYDKALEINESLGRRQKQAQVYANLGIVFQTRGELGPAEGFHYQALRIYKSLQGNTEAMANTYSNLGRLYKSLGSLTQAEAMFLEALNLREGRQPRGNYKMVVGYESDTR